MYIYKVYILAIYIYIYIYISKTKTSKKFISPRVIFWFLPSLRRLNKIMKILESINLKTNQNRLKE